MVERVARAVYEALPLSDNGVDYIPWVDLPDQAKVRAFFVARTAIAAMREPTLAMANAPYRSEFAQALKTDPPPYALAYQIMIDAELETDF